MYVILRAVRARINYLAGNDHALVAALVFAYGNHHRRRRSSASKDSIYSLPISA
jgi:hypothetical protein